MASKNKKNVVLYIVLIGVVLAGIVALMTMFQSSQTETKKYSEIISYFQDNKISEFRLNLGDGLLTYKLREDAEKKEETNTSSNVSSARDSGCGHCSAFGRSNDSNHGYSDGEQSKQGRLVRVRESATAGYATEGKGLHLQGSPCRLVC